MSTACSPCSWTCLAAWIILGSASQKRMVLLLFFVAWAKSIISSSFSSLGLA